MAKRSVFCLATSPNQAHQIVHRLQIAGFPHQDISVLFPKQLIADEVPHGKSARKYPWEPRLLSARAAWAAARRIGFASIGALGIPGGDGLIAAGPIIFALRGDGTATARGIAVGLMGIGIPELDAKHYEGRLKKGNILISVHANTPEEMIPAREVFRQAGAQDICTDAPAADNSAMVARHVPPNAVRSFRQMCPSNPAVVSHVEPEALSRLPGEGGLRV